MNKFLLLFSMFSVATLHAQIASDTLEILDLLEKNLERGVQEMSLSMPLVGKNDSIIKYGLTEGEERF